MSNPENNENDPEGVPQANSPYPEVDLSNPRKDGESWPSAYQQGDQDMREIQMGQFDDSDTSRQHE